MNKYMEPKLQHQINITLPQKSKRTNKKTILKKQFKYL